MAETGEIMLFGVRVVVDALRKSVSLNNLSQYEHRRDAQNGIRPIEDALSSASAAGSAGYTSADEIIAHPPASRGERKRGVPWTEEEHKLFLIGLKKVGKGDWRGISRNFVKTRTPTQVASHAQKYFLRRVNINRRRRRTSLFDITTDSLPAISMEEEELADNGGNNVSAFLMPAQSGGTPVNTKTEMHLLEQGNPWNARLGSGPSFFDLNLGVNMSPTAESVPVSLNLSLSRDGMAFPSRQLCLKECKKKGESIISVA